MAVIFFGHGQCNATGGVGKDSFLADTALGAGTGGAAPGEKIGPAELAPGTQDKSATV